MTFSNLYPVAIQKFDAINAQDPRNIKGIPQELLYAQQMTSWLNKLQPNASEALHLAARSQHIKRWAILRTEYPEGTLGYKQWRLALTKLHCETSSSVLSEIGYDSSIIQQVVSYIKKEKLKLDTESQTLEDVVCLVFLENYFADFQSKHDPEKVVDILRKTWKKMSEQGHAEALKLNLPEDAVVLVKRALSE